MISKSNKFIKYASIAAIAIVALAASLSSNNINLGKNILRGRASDAVSNTVSFTKTTGIAETGTPSIGGYTYIYSNVLPNGQTVYCYFDNSDTATSEYSSAMGYATTNSSYQTKIYFTDAKNITSDHLFQKIEAVYIRTSTSNSRSFYLDVSSDGVTYVEYASRISTTSSGNTLTFNSSDNVRSLRIRPYSSLSTGISEIRFTYSCSNSWIEPTVNVTGVSVDPTATLGLDEQLTLIPTIMPLNATDKSVTWSSSDNAVAIVDSNGTITAINEGNATITVRTNDGGFTASCTVTVSSLTSETYAYGTRVITINSDGTGVYTYNTTYTMHFTWVLSGNKYTFTKDAKEGDSESTNAWAYYCLFGSSKTTNTGTIYDSETLKIPLRNANGNDESTTSLTKIV